MSFLPETKWVILDLYVSVMLRSKANKQELKNKYLKY